MAGLIAEVFISGLLFGMAAIYATDKPAGGMPVMALVFTAAGVVLYFFIRFGVTR